MLNSFVRPTNPAALLKLGSTEMFSFCLFASSLEVPYLNQLLKEKKYPLGNIVIELIMVIFPTVRIETFVFAQPRVESGIYLLEL